MGLFNQKKDTVEWIEYRPDVLFYKWKIVRSRKAAVWSFVPVKRQSSTPAAVSTAF